MRSRNTRKLIDLGHTPLANRTVGAQDAWGDDEPSYPLRASVCDTCLLVQIEDAAPADQVGCNHAFLSSAPPCVSTTHAALPQQFGNVLASGQLPGDRDRIKRRLPAALFPGGASRCWEIDRGERSERGAVLGIPTEIGFFNAETAMEIAVQRGRADLVVADNVLPEVTDLFDFAAGFAGILRPNGVVAFQFPHVLSLLQKTQFDAFRRDRYSYLSLLVLERVLRSVGLRVFDAERLADHGGSLQVYACHARGPRAGRPSLKAVRHAESWAGLDRAESYQAFGPRMEAARDDVREFLECQVLERSPCSRLRRGRPRQHPVELLWRNGRADRLRGRP